MINGKQSLPGSANPGLDVMLRGVEKWDLEAFFRFQLGPDGSQLHGRFHQPGSHGPGGI